VASLAASGCVPVQNQPTQPRPQVIYSGGQPQPNNPNNTQVTSDLGSAGSRIFDDFSRATDPCAAQLQDICEALLMYYAVKRELPPSLDELARYMARGGTQLQLICPISGQPYLYNRNGPLLSNSLWLTDNTGRSVNVSNQMTLGHMVVFDPSPAHQGERWAIVFGKDTRGTSPVASPFRIPEKSFQDVIRTVPGAR
jgi:hypothetical protein